MKERKKEKAIIIRVYIMKLRACLRIVQEKCISCNIVTYIWTAAPFNSYNYTHCWLYLLIHMSYVPNVLPVVWKFVWIFFLGFYQFTQILFFFHLKFSVKNNFYEDKPHRLTLDVGDAVIISGECANWYYGYKKT